MAMIRTVIQLPEHLVHWLNHKRLEGYTKSGLIRQLLEKEYKNGTI